MVQWLRRRFITGLVVTVPLIISVAALVWVFRLVDGAMAPLLASWIGREVPGLGLVLTALLVLLAGVIATNMVGKRILQRAEGWLLLVPLFKTVYAPVKQLVTAFSPDNEYGFKRVVMVEEPGRGTVLGFLTREFTLTRGEQVEEMVVVYVPTNHLYLGDVIVYPAERVTYPDLTVQDGIGIFLTGGMAVPRAVNGRREPGAGPGEGSAEPGVSGRARRPV
jgi:uncharacterized membrane protein